MEREFVVKVNGKEVYKTKNFVDRVSLQSAQGEAGWVGGPGINEVNVEVVEHSFESDGVRRLEEVVEERRAELRKQVKGPPDRPSESANRAAWAKYAKYMGVEAEGKDKKELVELLGESK